MDENYYCEGGNCPLKDSCARYVLSLGLKNLENKIAPSYTSGYCKFYQGN